MRELALPNNEVAMNVGMLWFDNDPHTELPAKVNRAVDYYRHKYGLVPDLCLVHPSMLNGRLDLLEGLTGKVVVRPNRAVLPGHFWIGTEKKTKPDDKI
jgi:hypothetical protein